MRKLFPMLFVMAAATLGAPLATATAAPVAKHGIAVESNVIDVRDRRHIGGNKFHLNRGNFHRRGHFRHRGHFRRNFFWGGPVVIHRSYGRDCYWLKRRAINTGSRYWWRRYN